MPKRKWYSEATGELIGVYPDMEPPTNCPLCPLCGKPTEEWYGQTNQDVMGNDIWSENYVCYPCGIGTELVEVE